MGAETQTGTGSGSRTGAGTVMRTHRNRERERGWRLVEEHRIGTGTGVETVTRAVAEKETATRM